MKPLKGVKILGLVMNLPGPLVLWRLKELGADVTKIEPPAGDQLEKFYPDFYKKLTDGLTVRRMEIKPSPALDELLAKTQLLVTALRPKTLVKNGLDFSSLTKKYPNLSHISMTGYGGDDADWSGHDLTYQARRGFVFPPEMPLNCWSDLAGAQEAVIQSLALLSDNRAGKAGFAQVSLSEALDFYRLPMDYGMFGPGAHLTKGFPRYKIYETKEGWVAVAILENHFQERFQKETGVGDMVQEDMQKLFKQRTAEQWESWAREHDLPLAKVRNYEDGQLK